MAHPMGEPKRDGLRVGFDRRLKLELHGSRIASDGLSADSGQRTACRAPNEKHLRTSSGSGRSNGWHGMVGQFRLDGGNHRKWHSEQR